MDTIATIYGMYLLGGYHRLDRGMLFPGSFDSPAESFVPQ